MFRHLRKHAAITVIALAGTMVAVVWSVRSQALPPLIADQDEHQPRLLVLSDEKVSTLLAASKASPTLKRLLKAQYKAARTEAEARSAEFLAGRERSSVESLLASCGRLLDAERDLTEDKTNHIAAFEKYFQALTTVEKITQARYDAGRTSTIDLALSQYHRLRAEIWLARARDR